MHTSLFVLHTFVLGLLLVLLAARHVAWHLSAQLAPTLLFTAGLLSWCRYSQEHTWRVGLRAVLAAPAVLTASLALTRLIHES